MSVYSTVFTVKNLVHLSFIFTQYKGQLAFFEWLDKDIV